jgi:enoyl-CoA hydratase/carnithine racemase
VSRQNALLVSARSHVLTITINRPDKRNALNRELLASLREAIDRLERNPDLRVGIVTGAGTKAFCAGIDLSESRSQMSNSLDVMDRSIAGFVRYPRTKPIIAAVNGPALGAGFEIVLACDLAVAAPDAWFALPEVKRGIFPGGGGAIRLPQQIPKAIANEILLAGRRLTAYEAVGLGIVNRVVAADELVTEAQRLAADICRAAPLAVAATLVTAGAIRRSLESSAWEVNDSNIRFIRTTNDAKEGALAFVEKRLPKWTTT